ncbi:MAG: hypothetical protein V1926_01895 [Candidatus Peregrinibacteria bacterium]
MPSHAHETGRQGRGPNVHRQHEEQEKQREQLKRGIAQKLRPVLRGNTDGERVIELCTRELLGMWMDEVNRGLNLHVAGHMVESVVEYDIFPLLRESHGKNVDRPLVDVFSAAAEQMKLAREATTPESMDRQTARQRERDDDPGEQLDACNIETRHRLDSALCRRGSKGGRHTHILWSSSSLPPQ